MIFIQKSYIIKQLLLNNPHLCTDYEMTPAYISIRVFLLLYITKLAVSLWSLLSFFLHHYICSASLCLHLAHPQPCPRHTYSPQRPCSSLSTSSTFATNPHCMASCPLIPTELPMQTHKFKLTLHFWESDKDLDIVRLHRKSAVELTQQSSILKFISAPYNNSLHSGSIRCGTAASKTLLVFYPTLTKIILFIIYAVVRVLSK